MEENFVIKPLEDDFTWVLETENSQISFRSSEQEDVWITSNVMMGQKGADGPKGEPGSLTIFNVTNFPPPVIVPNALYFVGNIDGEKSIYTTDEHGNISQQINNKSYRFFNSNNVQIG